MSGESDVERALHRDGLVAGTAHAEAIGSEARAGTVARGARCCNRYRRGHISIVLRYEFGRTTFREAITPEPRKIAFWSELVEANNAPSA
jgi:hypothetical protein